MVRQMARRAPGRLVGLRGLRPHRQGPPPDRAGPPRGGPAGRRPGAGPGAELHRAAAEHPHRAAAGLPGHRAAGGGRPGAPPRLPADPRELARHGRHRRPHGVLRTDRQPCARPGDPAAPPGVAGTGAQPVCADALCGGRGAGAAHGGHRRGTDAARPVRGAGGGRRAAPGADGAGPGAGRAVRRPQRQLLPGRPGPRGAGGRADPRVAAAVPLCPPPGAAPAAGRRGRWAR